MHNPNRQESTALRPPRHARFLLRPLGSSWSPTPRDRPSPCRRQDQTQRSDRRDREQHSHHWSSPYLALVVGAM